MIPHDLDDFLIKNETGILRFGGARMALLDIAAGFWGIYRQMVAMIGTRLTNSVIQQAGTNGGASFAQSFSATLDQSGSSAFSTCLQVYQTAGFGRFEITSLEWPIGRIQIQADQTFEAWMMRQHDHPGTAPCCAYTAGVLVGFVNIISNRKDVVCIEHACQGNGDEFCEFELLPASEARDQTVVSFSPDPGLGRQINLLEMLFDRMPMGIAVLDREYRVQRYNPTWRDFSASYAPPSGAPITPGIYYFDHLPGTESVVVPLFKRALNGETVRQNGVRLESEGIVTFWDIVLAPLVENNKIVGILNVAVDATERSELGQNLEQRVEERTKELMTLLQVSQDINSNLVTENLLDIVLDQLKTVVDYTGASILTFDDDDLLIRAYRGPIPKKKVQQLRFPLEKALLNREVIQQQQPIIIADTQDDLPLAQMFRQTAGDQYTSTFDYVRSWLGVPLMVKGVMLGMLTLDYSQPNHFTTQQANLVQTFANQVAVALENARLHQAEQDRQRELQILLDVAETANSSLNLDEVLIKTLDLLVTLIAASRAGVILVDENTGELGAFTLRPERDIDPDDLARMIQACQSVVASGESLYIAPDFGSGVLEPGALLPLQTRGRIMGVLGIIGSDESTFTPEQLALFKSIADQLGIAIENAYLFEKAEDAAIATERNRLARDLHDAVTQTLFSASMIADVLPKIWERKPEEGQRRLEELRQLTRGALSEMRTLLVELRPAALEDTDLGDLIGHQVNAFNARTRIPVDFERNCDKNPPAAIKEVFYRIVQEAFNNIAKHAEATTVKVQINSQSDRTELVIQDDGLGFDFEVAQTEGLGLGIMAERARLSGAELKIYSHIGQGTQLQLLWTES